MAVDRRISLKSVGAAALFAVAFTGASFGPVAAQEATGPVDTVTFGLETYESIEAAVWALFARQVRLEEAIMVFQQQLGELAAISNATSARLSRGDEPLVSLEIEQLWAMVRSLEEENARLRDGYEQLLAAPGE